MTNLPVLPRILSPQKKHRKKPRGSGAETPVDPRLLEMARLRTAQICHSQPGVETHTKALEAQKESTERIRRLEVWQESQLYSDREKAALAIGEALALGLPKTISATIVHEARAHLTDPEIIHLTLAILAVIDWNYSLVKRNHS